MILTAIHNHISTDMIHVNTCDTCLFSYFLLHFHHNSCLICCQVLAAHTAIPSPSHSAALRPRQNGDTQAGRPHREVQSLAAPPGDQDCQDCQDLQDLRVSLEMQTHGLQLRANLCTVHPVQVCSGKIEMLFKIFKHLHSLFIGLFFGCFC